MLVTGGAGFVGRHVVDALIERGESVRVLDDLSAGSVAGLHPSAELVVGDVTDSWCVNSAMAGARGVVHLAARRAVPRSFDDPAGTDRVNRVGTAIVLDAARRARVRRLVFASSSSVYGDARVTPTPETAMASPLSPYARSKADGEALCRAAARTGLDTVCLRYFNVYGPGQPAGGPYALLIPRVLDALRRGDPVVVHGDGLQRRDFTYISDGVRATLAALWATEVFDGQALNVSGGQSWTVLETIALLATELDVSPALRFTESRRGDPRRTEGDLRLAAQRLHYRPTVALPAGLRLVVADALAGVAA